VGFGSWHDIEAVIFDRFSKGGGDGGASSCRS
jgi:hypothetical protein